MAAKDDGLMDTMHEDNTTEAESIQYYDATVVDRMMEACVAGDLAQVQSIVDTYGDLYASQQVDATGCAPLMAAASGGFANICHYLLQQGAPWNAVDRYGQCAGNVATDREHWDVVNLLVEWGTRAELILGRIEREQKRLLRKSAESVAAEQAAAVVTTASSTNGTVIPVSHEPSTKPDYLQQRLRYTADGQSLLDADMDAVMMEWERPLMRAHAQALMETTTTSTIMPTMPQSTTAAAHPPQHTIVSANHSKKRVLNVGFGMGIIDSILQDEWQPSHHIIIEAHPDVYQRMIDTGWTDSTKRPNVRVCLGTWQDVVPQLVAEGIVVDAIFYDTYGEHFLDMEDFHSLMVKLLAKPHGVYSFFNGLAPDNLFFHGVACQCVKLQLASLGLDSDFVPCQIQNVNPDDAVWQGIRRQYWHGRDTYYLPVCKWNAHFLSTGQAVTEAAFMDAAATTALEPAHVARLQQAKRKAQDSKQRVMSGTSSSSRAAAVADPNDHGGEAMDAERDDNDDVVEQNGIAAKRLQTEPFHAA